MISWLTASLITFTLMLSLYVIPVASDECSFFHTLNPETIDSHLKNDLPSADSNAPDSGDFVRHIFCGDSQMCVVGATVTGKSCLDAYVDVQPSQIPEVDDVWGLGMDPVTKTLTERDLDLSRADDEQWIRIRKIMRQTIAGTLRRIDRREAELDRWDARLDSSPDKFTINQLESLIEPLVNQLGLSFPRPTSLENLQDGWLSQILEQVDRMTNSFNSHSARKTLVSILRNCETMRRFSWYISATIQYALKERNEELLGSYLMGASPFVFVFNYIGVKLGIHYPKLLRWSQNFITTITKLSTPISDLPWHLVISEGSEWTYPELPLLTQPFVVWNHVLGDVGFKAPPRPREDMDAAEVRLFLHSYLIGALEACLDLALSSKNEDIQISNMKRASYALNYLDKKGADLSEFCESRSDRLGELAGSLQNIPEAIAYQTVMSILGRCKPFLDLTDRLTAFVEPLVVDVENMHIQHIWISEERMPRDLVSRLSLTGKHTLGGVLIFSRTPTEVNMDVDEESSTTSSKLPGGVKLWFENSLERIFQDDTLFTRLVDGTCQKYVPNISPVSFEDRELFRGVGVLLGLYIREGFSMDILSRYVKTCSDDESVHETLFFGSHSIRSGVYSVFVEGDFERTLVNGKEVEAMLQILGDPENANFFKTNRFARIMTV